MTGAAFRQRALVAGLLARAEDWLLRPAEEVAASPIRARAPALPEPLPRPEPMAPPEPAPPPERANHPVIAVMGLRAGCGTTTVARALAAELAARRVAGVAAVACTGSSGAVPLARLTASRLARALGPYAEGRVRAAGRLCLVDAPNLLHLVDAARREAPLVVDVRRDGGTGEAAALADRVVLVASPLDEPALPAVVAASLARSGPEPITVANRVSEPDRWAGRVNLLLPETRLAAQVALAGREPRGPLGRTICELADRCEGPACD
jgi:hypothetical protein